MMTTPTTVSHPNDVSFHETLNQSPSDGFVGFSPPPPPPPPPLFNSNSTQPTTSKIILPQQEVNLVIDRTHLSDIQARSIPVMFTSSKNIWTRCVLPNLRIKQTVFDQHFGDCKSPKTDHRFRRTSVSMGSPGGGGVHTNTNDEGSLSLVLLDAASKMLYDVPMRHLLQLVKKDHDDDASIDHVIRAIDQAQMKSEWLDAVIALHKQFDKRPEDKARVLAHQGSPDGLVLIEQFFIKLVRVPAYELKLIFLKFQEEAPAQLERMNKHIHDLLEAIQVILHNDQLPGILHLLCLLYNSITGKTIPGLHFDSILSVLSTRTGKQTTTIAHVLCHLLEEQYPNLLNVFENGILLKLKDFASIKYLPIYVDIRLFYTRYQQLNQMEDNSIVLPEHMKTTLQNLQVLFTNLFELETQIKQGEKDLGNYFCTYDLTLETCLSTLGQFLDKLRLAHLQNAEQQRRNQQRMISTPTTTRSPRNSLDSNIFRDHLNVPLTPSTARQRWKVNRMSRDRHVSSRDILDDHEQMIQQNSTIARKREHSPGAKTVFTKRPFNVLSNCLVNTSQDETDDEQENIQMDCSAIVPKSMEENQPVVSLQIPIRNLLDCLDDQSIPLTKSPDHSTKRDENQIPLTTTMDVSTSNVDLCKTTELNSSNNQSIIKIYSMTKRASSVDNIRLHRCGVSRRICNENDVEQISPTKPSRRTSSTKCKPPLHSNPSRPLRALPTSTIVLSPKSPCKFTRLTVEKTLASRTITTTVLPSFPLLKFQ